MKKIFIALFTFLSVLALVGCNETTGGGKTPAAKKTVIKYCGWDLGTDSAPTMKRKMIQEFNKNSSTIRIEMLPSQDPLPDFFTKLAANKSLPDVYLYNSIPTAVYNEWAMDLTSLVENDDEWVDVDANLKESITYNGKVFALPAAQNYVGLFANYELIDEYATISDDAENVFAPGAFTYQQLFDAIEDIKSISNDGTSVVGINAVGDMINWLPSIIDTEGKFDHFVWDGSKFDFTGTVIKETLTKISDLGKISAGNHFNAYAVKVKEDDPDPRIELFGSADPATVFIAGQIGFYQGMTSDNVSNIKFDYSFVGYPDNRVVSAGDFMCISENCSNPEAAYEVAKFLTFGADGINTRYKIVDENKDIELSGLPVNTNKEVTEKWFDYVEMKGVKEIYESVIAGETKLIVEGLKTIPGFESARYTLDTGIKIEGVRNNATLTIGDLIWDVCEGAISVGEYNSNMTAEKAALLNREVIEALEKIKGITG